jgi:tetratricopeptide (TPR) repeat protein
VALLTVLGAGAWSARAPTADVEIARALLQSAKEAHDKKKYDDALVLLDKALNEAPDLREVHYWMGACQDKKGDVANAVRTFRRFREVLADDAAATKAEKDMLKKAQARLAVIAPGEVEEERLRTAFAADLLALAKGKEAKDPASALLVIDTLLQADPLHAEAGAAAARLRASTGQVPLPPPLAALKTWKDVYPGHLLKGTPEWSWADGVYTVDIHDRSTPGVPGQAPVGLRFALDMELRVLQAYGPRWALGFALDDRVKQKLAALAVEESAMVAMQGPPVGGLAVLTNAPITPLPLKTWHRFSLQIEAPKVVAWVNGKKVSTFAVDGITEASEVRFFVDRCKAEIRTFRWAKLE